MATGKTFGRIASMAVHVVVATLVSTVHAYTWTGGGSDDRWTNPSNWGGGGYPCSSADTAEFNSSATVTLDTSSALAVGCVKVAANATVTVNGTSGSALNPFKAASVNGNGFIVGADGKLVLNVPVVSSGRIDKWQSGEVVFNKDVTISGNVYFLIDCGTVTLQDSAVLSLTDGTLGLGNSSDRQQVTLNVKDAARITVKEIMTTVANNGSTGSGRIVQDGGDTDVYVSGALTLSGASGTSDKGVYELKAGVLTAGGTISLGKSGTGSSGAFGGGLFVQSGGRAVISGNFTTVLQDGSGIDFSGGTLAFPNTTYYYTIGASLSLSGKPTLEVPSSGYVTLPASTVFAPETELAVTGGGNLFTKNNLATSGSLEVSGCSFLVDEPYNSSRDVEIHALSGDESPWPVTLANNGRLQVSLINKRVTRPLALSVASGGNIRFVYADGADPLFARSILVAHSLSVDGVEKGKGRYTKDNLSTIFSNDSAPFASVVVPYVWSGAGDGASWRDPANWEGGAVPPSDSDTCVDISRAAGRTLVLDEAKKLSCIIFNPQGSQRKATISGNGKIIHDCPSWTVGMFVGPGRELVFDVDVEKPSFAVASYNSPAIMGGGRITVKKNFPGTTRDDTSSYKRPGYVLDGELAFAGRTRFLAEETSKLFGIGTWEIAGRSRIVFEEGCDVEAYRLDPSPIRNIVSSDEWVQNGGSVSLRNFYFTSYFSKRRTPFSYTLNGGNMSVEGEFCLGSAYYTADARYPGGDFIMNGGTLTVGEFRCQRNDNHIYLNGGDVFLKSGFSDTFANAVQGCTNELALVIGGAAIHSTAAWTSALTAEFSGKNGAATFDTAGFDATFSKPVGGAGGLVKNGAGILSFSGAANFTGPVIVNGGSVVFGSTVNGPSDFTVRSGALSFQARPSAEFDSIVVPSVNDLVVSAAASGFSVKRLVVGGIPQESGSVAVNGGTVNVTGTDLSVWKGPNGGSWSSAANWTAGVPNGVAAAVDFGFSSLDSEASIQMDADVTVKNLSYSHGASGASLTLSGTCGLTFASGGAITVPSGNTLVIDSNVTLLGETVKKGAGTLIVNGGITSAGGSDTYWLIAEEGEVEINGTVSKCRLRVESSLTTPVLTVGRKAVVGDSVSVNPGWSAKSGEVVQNGGVVDINPPSPGFASSGCWTMTYGTGKYTLNDGELRLFSRSRFLWMQNDKLDFVQNGGVLKTDVMGYDERPGVISYTLNGGTNEIATSWSANANGRNTAYLNGGTIVSGGNAAMFSSDFDIVFGGDVTFVQKTPEVSVALGDNVSGAGTICQAGPGTLSLGAQLGEDFSLDIESGRVSIDCDEVVVRRLVVNGHERAAGRYSAAGKNLGGRIAGTGELVVLEGRGRGFLLVVR